MAEALAGIRILDLSQGAAGPTCAMLLAELGATVVKIEPPGGEWGRRLGPPFVGGAAAAFLGMNRGKRSVVVDMKAPGAAGVVVRVAEQCDVALESFRPGVADRLGIGYTALSAANEGLIYAAISAFGQEGAWKSRPGVDGVAQAMSGIMSVTGTEDGPPVKVGVPAADMAGGIFASQAILAALFQRERTGRGQRVDVSLLDALLAFQVVPLSMYLASGTPPRRLGSAAPYAAPNEAFATSDGHVMVAAYASGRWPRLCAVLGRPELAEDERFATNHARVEHRSELLETLQPLFAEKTTAEWLALLDEADILCGPLLTYPELVASEPVEQALITVEHDATGPVRTVLGPVQLGGSRSAAAFPAPAVPGEHTTEVLAEFGFAAEEIDTLLERGVVGDRASDDQGG